MASQQKDNNPQTSPKKDSENSMQNRSRRFIHQVGACEARAAVRLDPCCCYYPVKPGARAVGSSSRLRYISRSPPLQSQWAAFSASRRLGTISPSSLTGTAHCSRGLREWQPRAKEGKPDGLRDVGGGGVIRHPFSRELLPHRRTVSFVEIASARGRQAMCLTCLLPVQDR